MSKVCEIYGLSGYTNPQALLFGIECEIESIRDCAPISWQITEDGSLRNNGREFISPPVSLSTAVEGFKTLHESLSVRKREEKFSDRTSIHVHVNCQNLDEDVVRNIIHMYALYEEFFFSMCSPDRRHNIHCVPLTETHLPSIYRMSLVNMTERWHKYTALNIKPLAKYGTLEFRHMQGHEDGTLFEEWLQILNNLFQLASSKEGLISKDTISNTNLDLWFDTLFGKSRVANLKPLMREMTYNQRLDIKLMLAGV
jgi:Putative amidoligase enzyme